MVLDSFEYKEIETFSTKYLQLEPNFGQICFFLINKNQTMGNNNIFKTLYWYIHR